MKLRPAFTMIELVFIIVILGILAAIAVPKMAANREDTLLVAIKTDLETIKQSVVAMAAGQGESTVNSFGDALVLNESLWGAVEPSGTQGFGAFTATPLKQATAIASKYTPKNPTGGAAAAKSCASVAIRTKIQPYGRSDVATVESRYIEQGKKYMHIFIWNSSECQKHFGKPGARVIPLGSVNVAF